MFTATIIYVIYISSNPAVNQDQINFIYYANNKVNVWTLMSFVKYISSCTSSRLDET
jgi:hypothetical protein